MMMIDSTQWRQALTRGAGQMGVTLTGSQVEHFVQFCRMVLTWNRKINLTSITDPMEMAVKHILDSIAAVNRIQEQGSLLDIGTGGGFPGIPLKIMRPRLSMTLIDGVRKKISFVRHACRHLGLTNVEALHLRAEELSARLGAADLFDVIVTRAVSDIQSLLPLAASLLADQGTIIFYKSPREAARVADLFGARGDDPIIIQSRSFQIEHVTYALPISGDPRDLILFKQRSSDVICPFI